MKFPFNVYVFAVAGGWLTAFATLPVWRRWCWRKGLVDDPGARKLHDRPIPLAGGLTLLTGLVVPTVVATLALLGQSRLGYSGAGLRLLSPHSTDLLVHGLGKRAFELGSLMVGALGMLIVGLLDDKHELRPLTKLAGQILAAILVAASGARITLFVPSIVFSYAITILWVLTLVNALNFLDNMNGLCTGLGALGAGYFALLAAAADQYLVALIAFLISGALLGFLPYNFPRATAFLGDSGSHLVGYLLAVLAILPHFSTPQHPHPWAVLSPLLVLAVPLLDLVWVVCLRWRMRKPIYVGDTNHLSHRLVRLGLSRTQAVLLIWAISAGASSLAFLL